jgi:hypothetical protein
MCLVKSSELQGAVAIPYEIVRSIIALPTAVFEVKIGNIGDNIELLNAERQVIAAQQEYLDFLAEASRVEGSPGKQTFEGPHESQIANPKTVTLTGIAKASMDTLQSSVLDRICSSAPGVIGVE